MQRLIHSGAYRSRQTKCRTAVRPHCHEEAFGTEMGSLPGSKSLDLRKESWSTKLQEAVLDGDWSSTFYMARGIMQLQKLFGPIPVIKGIGLAAEAAADELGRSMRAAGAASQMPGCFNVPDNTDLQLN